MQLTANALGLLYGKRLFVMPPAAAKATAAAPVPVATEAPVEVPTGLAWQLPSTARLGIAVPEAALVDPGQRELLEKIVAAMGLTLGQQALLAWPEPPAPAPPPPLTLPVVCFGQPPWPAPLTTGAVFRLPTLAALHSDVALKRSAWEQIKTFKDTL